MCVCVHVYIYMYKFIHIYTYIYSFTEFVMPLWDLLMNSNNFAYKCLYFVF